VASIYVGSASRVWCVSEVVAIFERIVEPGDLRAYVHTLIRGSWWCVLGPAQFWETIYVSGQTCRGCVQDLHRQFQECWGLTRLSFYFLGMPISTVGTFSVMGPEAVGINFKCVRVIPPKVGVSQRK
jgi:hypothetical protein